MLDRDTGALIEKTLKHEGEAVREFYTSIPLPVVVGIEATGSMGWFLRLMEELAIECRVGHPVAIRKAEARRQKHDRRDAALLLRLLAEDRFPTIWMPSTELRDLRALLLHRHQWVRMRTRPERIARDRHGARHAAGPYAMESRGPGVACVITAGAAHRPSSQRAPSVVSAPGCARRPSWRAGQARR